MRYSNVLIILDSLDIDTLIEFFKAVKERVREAIGYRGDVYISSIDKIGNKIYLIVGVEALDEDIGRVIETVIDTSKQYLTPEEVITS